MKLYCTFAGFVCAAALSPLYGQGVPVLQRNDVEVSAFGASSFGSGLGGLAVGTGEGGLDPVQVVTPSSNGVVGVQFNYAPLRRLRVYAEWAYLTGGGVTLNQDYVVNIPPLNDRRRDVRAHTRSFDTGFGMQVLFPLKRVPRFVPYAYLGMSHILTTGGFSTAVIGDVPEPALAATAQNARNALSTGGGIRYYFTERAGVQI